MSNNQNLVKLIYSINGEESSVAFNPNNKVSVLKNLISLTQNISNLEEYECFYKQREIKWNDENTVSSLIGKDLVPVFRLRKKNSEKEKNENKGENEKGNFSRNTERTKSNALKKNDDSNKGELSHLKCIVSVVNFPSRTEIYKLIEEFVGIDSETECQMNTKGGSIEIAFKNPDKAYEFSKKLNLEKINNPLYSKIKTTISLDTKHKNHHIPNNRLNRSSGPNLNDEKSNEQANKFNLKSSIFKNESKNKHSKSINVLNQAKMMEHIGKIKDESVKQAFLKKYYKSAKFLSLASPYITQEDLARKDYKDNKKKWLIKSGFKPTIHKEKEVEIPNFVNLDVYYSPVSSYKFRDNDKKFLENKDFKRYV